MSPFVSTPSAARASHIIIYYGPRKTVVKDRRKELPPGLLSAMARHVEQHEICPGLDTIPVRTDTIAQ